MTDLNTPLEINTLGITLRDLLNMYLREIETLQGALARLEHRVEINISRLDSDIRQNGTITREDISMLRDDLNGIRDHVSTIESTIGALNNTLTTMINDAETRRRESDHAHELQLKELQIKIGLIGGIAGTIFASVVTVLVDYIRSLVTG